MKERLRRLWRGELGLAKTFWIWSFLIGWIGFFFIRAVVTAVVYGPTQVDEAVREDGLSWTEWTVIPEFFLPLFVIELAYNVAIYKCLFSAFPKSGSLWRYGTIPWVFAGILRFGDELALLAS